LNHPITVHTLDETQSIVGNGDRVVAKFEVLGETVDVDSGVDVGEADF
jgi:hypothetical protein